MSTLHRETLRVRAGRRGLHEITHAVRDVVRASGVRDGSCHLFLRHTSASLVVQENADPTARADLEEFLDRLVPDGTPWFRHTAEGPDDMPAHVKAMLTATSLTIPVMEGELGLGTWQGIYLFEHRDRAGSRSVVVTVS